MRLGIVLSLLLLFVGCESDVVGPRADEPLSTSSVQSKRSTPPPPHDFGPDVYRTGAFTGQGITRPGLNCGASSGRGRVCTGFLPSAVDGTLLDVTVMVPHGRGPHPLVVLLHGWGGSKNDFSRFADALVEEGHAVLRYSARGFGRSWGQANIADVHVEIPDLRSMIGQVVDRRGFRLNPDAVAVTGVSYGGGHSWLALLEPSFDSPDGATVRIRTVVPMVGWSDLLYSLMPNGRPERSIGVPGSPKLSYINGLYFSGLRTAPDRPYPNYPDYLIAWHTWFNSMEPNDFDPVYRQIVDGMAGYRSIWWQHEFWREATRRRVPVFQVQGLTDDLFPLPEAKRMLLALKAVDPLYPIASYFGDIGHSRAGNKAGEVDYMLRLVREWLAYYLQGSGSEPAHVIRAAITRPRSQPFSPEDVITVGSYDELATGTRTKVFDGSATLVNPVTDPYSGFYWDPLVMEAARELKPYPELPPAPALVESSLGVYEVEVKELAGGTSLLVAGQPAISLRASTAAPRVQLNVRLIDLGPDGTRQLITRGTYLLEPGGSGTATGTAEVTIPTYGNLWEAAPEHRLRVEITNVDSPHLTPSRIPSVTKISDVRLEIPVR